MIKTAFSMIIAIFVLTSCQAQSVQKDALSVNFEASGPHLPAPEGSADGGQASEIPEPIVSEVKKQQEEILEPKATLKILNHAVPFTSQAPYEVWDELHQEACEEASLVMVDAFFRNKELTKHAAEQGILSFYKWQNENGYVVDLTAQEIADTAKNYFNLQSEVITKVNVKNIKLILDQKKLIILPLAGRELKNPYFQNPGPIYHVLVIKGYDDNNKRFITNDPGTRRGKNFSYSYDVILDAIHDWDHELAKDGMTDEEIKQGRKAMVAIWL